MLYDLNKSFAHHWQHGFNFDHIKNISFSFCDHPSITIFGHTISSRIGIPACPLTTAQGIKVLARLGYSIFTYKTIRSKPISAHSMPNVAYVPTKHMLTQPDINKIFPACAEQPAGDFGLANSFGNASFTPELMQADIATARQSLSDKQLLIVSVYGSGENSQALCKDYADTALLAQEAGAQAIECNISCPNIPRAPPLYEHLESVYKIIKAVTKAVHIPVGIKIGFITQPHLLKKLVITTARAGAQSICTTNSIPVQAINTQQKTYFGPDRSICGLSGNPIRALALQSITDIRTVISQEKLPLTLLGTGGITKAEHIDQFFTAGADIAMSATGVMLDPLLAATYLSRGEN